MHVRPFPRFCWAALTLLAVLAGLLGLQPGRATAAAAALTQVTGFGSNPGNLLMYRYVPTGLASGRPLVVALHGCTQSAAAFDEETGWTRWAEQWGFALLLPQQQSANNSSSCFNWYQSGDFSRDQGEALSIRQMIDRTRADLDTDAARVYVTGLSAGGAMTAALLADYPDVFAGGGVVAGLPARCATSQTQASVDCMTTGRNLTPQQWGDLVRGSAPSWTGRWPKVSIWHGSSDYVVKSTNLTELMEQWTDANGIGQTPTVSDTVGGYPHAVYADADGQARVETYSLTGMGHGQPVDPGSGAEQCGVAGAYLLDVNICASYRIGKFWGLDGSSPTPTPSPSPTGGTGTLTLTDDTSRDGYVKANADGSAPAVGTLAGSLGLAVGRGTDGKQNRSLLSFDTTALPAGAVVTAARLTVSYGSGSGNPWGEGQLTVDTRSGCFGAACTTGTDDYTAPADAPAVATLAAFSSGTRVSTDFTAAGLAAITPGGTVQLRLGFDHALASTGYLFLQRGANAVLTLEYRR
ncbi:MULTISPECIES: PHB depolymerase family esterase [unclassified Kitasatospora]|uniref:extracellular catalytic domain type 1 short-chain-length polyhydroxyalkanoate depolymerase n=1 Tax=unclassified Kitasatospora TaxID=2633591 RepID=UPI00070EE45A|nr:MULTISPECIES: PHB depolymerase family esterase [unclassified Kitasatospora]KQV18659.1 esterase [Kitasatospora sp. Root107]KRB74641.1 esterase [Kitasatospora sp. Root187]